MSQVLYATRDVMEELVSTSQKKCYSLKSKNARINMVNKILEYYNITAENINEVYALLEKKDRKERFQELHKAYPELFTKFHNFGVINANFMTYLNFKFKELNQAKPEPVTEPEPEPRKLRVAKHVCETQVIAATQTDPVMPTMVYVQPVYKENALASNLLKAIFVFAIVITHFMKN